ncbi:hypothetical protein [Pseudoxanthomonas sp. Root630]|uniref:hypothetical protein n=1 Tax=Pseudoxanthomonas sp. Root630 TaxID=1736574 RepID=UPI00070243D5|nr:hypothetical protein [Pseudoxanthomonas sp. Root630]KRA46473.1 hypothetical protein ASD72_04520 [Pseudoxanthomonas sp. Root630]
MKNNDTVTREANEDIEARARRYTDALLTLQPKAQHQKTQLFTLLYPTIVELLSKHVSQKAILDMLQAQGLKLHPSRFKALMAAHATGADNESGDPAERSKA